MQKRKWNYKNITLLLSLIILICFIPSFLLGACKKPSDSQSSSPEAIIIGQVVAKSSIEYIGSTIGGNELVASKATVANVEKKIDYDGETYYIASGKMTMTDKYGNTWSNTYDVRVTFNEETRKCTVGAFKYTSTSWKKS